MHAAVRMGDELKGNCRTPVVRGSKRYGFFGTGKGGKKRMVYQPAQNERPEKTGRTTTRFSPQDRDGGFAALLLSQGEKPSDLGNGCKGANARSTLPSRRERKEQVWEKSPLSNTKSYEKDSLK